MLPLRFFLPLLALTPTLAWAQFPPEIITALDDAIALYRRVRAERLRLATDTNERGEVLIGAGFFEGGVDPALVFQIGDEAFELEPDRALGLGAAEAYGPPPLPARSRRVHDGERGGLDAGSCRACHFVGGPDGAGAPTQQALFRGDGRHRSTATVRDAPHVMGLGYLARAARELERGLAARVDIARSQAADLGEPVRAALVVDGINFGAVTAGPDGALDATELRGVGPDLRIRPFGHKGRHADLVSLADEALAVHLGIQTEGRLDTY
ncbi:MAG: hypothetical protein KC620_26150, partial [Myxococcales bacterium]|nr:hypothetical protein [Myxococcales bacterium]